VRRRCRHTLTGHTDCVEAVAIGPDGRVGVSAGRDRAVWDLESGRCRHVLEGHTQRIWSVVTSADGRLVVSGGADRTVRVWDLATGLPPLRAFEGHPAGVRSVAISADGCHVLAGSRDGTVRVWELDWDHDFPLLAAWDEGARPYLKAFLARHAGRPWTEADLAWLTGTLREVGYGWLEERGVRAELARMWDARDDAPRAGVHGQGGRSA